LLVRDLESSHLNPVPGEDNALKILQGHSITPRGRVRYTLKTPYRNGTTPEVFAPLDFISRWRAKITPAGRRRFESPILQAREATAATIA